MNTEYEIPESFDYNETDLDDVRETLRESTKEEIFKGVVKKVTRTISRNKKNPEQSTNNMQLEFTLQAVDADGKPTGPFLRRWVDIPVPNPKVPGHKPYGDADSKKKAFKRAREVVRALLGDDALPSLPRKNEATGKYVDPDSGETLDPKGYAAIEKRVNDATISTLQKWWKECPAAEVVGAVTYFATKRNGQYTNIQYMRHDDGGKSVITEGFTVPVES